MIQLGSVIKNRYKIVRSIGKGGFGETFEVDDRGRRKVLKVLRHFSDPKEQKKPLCLFQREAEVLMKLNRPGIPKVEPDGCLTWQEGSNTRYGFVMEKIDGKSLDKWLEERGDTITEADAIDWLKQLLLILEYVHDHGYIHRDIKPSNIMVKPNNQLVLIDWGTVKEITSTYLVKVVEEIPATKLMSPGYTPLEQIQGKPVPPSDFFALGRTFVYLLTGKEPGEFPEDYLTEQLIWRNQAPTVSESLGDLIDGMMRVFPRERPKNTQEIWQVLKTCETNLFPQNKPSFLGKYLSAAKWNKGIKTWTKSGLKIIVNRKFLSSLLVTLSILFLWKNNILTWVTDELFSQGAKRFEAKNLDQAELLYRLALFLDPNYPEIYFSLGKVYEKRAEKLPYLDKKANFDLAETEYRQAIKLKPIYDKPYNNLGRLLILKGQSNAAIPLLKNGLDLTKNKDVEYTLLKNLGWAFKEQKQYEKATVYLQQALASKGKLAPAHCLLALVIEEQGDRARSLEKWKNCLRYASEENFDEIMWKAQAQERLQSQKMEK
jgi:serine/threonine protein kinase